MVMKIKPQRAQSVVIFIFRPLCVLCGFPKNPISKISKSLCEAR